MARSFVGGFLGALLALALVGAVGAVLLQQRGPAARDQERATLLRQIDEYERWRRDDPVGRMVWMQGMDEAHRQYLAWHPELSAYMAWYATRFQNERCGGGRSWVCDAMIAEALASQLRDPAYLDAYLAARR